MIVAAETSHATRLPKTKDKQDRKASQRQPSLPVSNVETKTTSFHVKELHLPVSSSQLAIFWNGKTRKYGD